jgi:hypothetical protein
MSIMLMMSCYTGFFDVRRGWQSLNKRPRFYLRLIRSTGWLWIYTSQTTDGCPFKPKKFSVPFPYPRVPAGLALFRGIVPLGRINLVPILPLAHPVGGGSFMSKLLLRFQNILRNTTQVIIQHRVKILFSVISSSITLERQKWKSSNIKGILLASPVSC